MDLLISVVVLEIFFEPFQYFFFPFVYRVDDDADFIVKQLYFIKASFHPFMQSTEFRPAVTSTLIHQRSFILQLLHNFRNHPLWIRKFTLAQVSLILLNNCLDFPRSIPDVCLDSLTNLFFALLYLGLESATWASTVQLAP